MCKCGGGGKFAALVHTYHLKRAYGLCACCDALSIATLLNPCIRSAPVQERGRSALAGASTEQAKHRRHDAFRTERPSSGAAVRLALVQSAHLYMVCATRSTRSCCSEHTREFCLCIHQYTRAVCKVIQICMHLHLHTLNGFTDIYSISIHKYTAWHDDNDCLYSRCVRLLDHRRGGRASSAV